MTEQAIRFLRAAADNVSPCVRPASIAVNPVATIAGSTIMVSGSSFTSSAAVVIALNGTNLPLNSAVLTDAGGSFSTTVLVPGLIGVNTVSVTVNGVTVRAPLTITSAASSGPVPVATAFAPLGSILQLASSFNYAQSKYLAYVPNLAGNQLTQVQPNSVIILTLTRDALVVVSGIAFTVRANTPTPISVGANVTIGAS